MTSKILYEENSAVCWRTLCNSYLRKAFVNYILVATSISTIRKLRTTEYSLTPWYHKWRTLSYNRTLFPAQFLSMHSYLRLRCLIYRLLWKMKPYSESCSFIYHSALCHQKAAPTDPCNEYKLVIAVSCELCSESTCNACHKRRKLKFLSVFMRLCEKGLL